ncbi:NAD(P)-binding Rossmann-fold superfamily protein [Forsythia ovata]|uniref:NAD(P)-binding Rossmann-fold superfamily protein n=1 Tax=Forsythia ovata TaxID=205694 RepID=A0ABD1W9F2_9LAMI
MNRNNRIWEVPIDEFNVVIDTNIKGTTNMLRHFIPLMIEKKQGIIVNMSSRLGRYAAVQESIEKFASMNLELLDVEDDVLTIHSKLQGLKIYFDELYTTIND